MITTVKRKYICKDCKFQGHHINAIKNVSDIYANFSNDRIEDLENINETSLYMYDIVRDDDDLPSIKIAKKLTCESCGSTNIERVKELEYDNVLNFYPQTEAEKWYDHLN